MQAFNAAYGFTLARKAADAPWALRNVRQGDNRYNPDDWEVNGWISLYMCIRMAEFRLADLVRKPTFRVVRAAAVQRDGTELVQIDFDNTHPWNNVPYDPIQGGTLWLDPDRFWTLRSYTVIYRTRDGDGTDKGEYELHDPAAKYPVPKRSVGVVDMPDPKGNRRVRTTVIESYLEVPSRLPRDEEFTLSAFGLPEPKGATWPTRPRWYLWFIAAAVLSLAAGGFFWRRIQRRAS